MARVGNLGLIRYIGLNRYIGTGLGSYVGERDASHSSFEERPSCGQTTVPFYLFFFFLARKRGALLLPIPYFFDVCPHPAVTYDIFTILKWIGHIVAT